MPLFSEDRELKGHELRKQRCAWLERHDQETRHLASMLPLVKSLPVRLTGTINRSKKLYRGRRGRIIGWQLHPDTEKECDEGECILSRQPVTIFVKFTGVTWRIKNLEEGVYPLTQASRTWLVPFPLNAPLVWFFCLVMDLWAKLWLTFLIGSSLSK